MAYETHARAPTPLDRPIPFTARLAAWLKARLADLRVVAEVLHEHQWSSPWEQSAASEDGVGERCDR